MNFLHNICGSINIVDALKNLWESTGLYDLVANFGSYGWQNLVMILISCVLVYLAVVKKFEPLLLLPIAFGMFIVNVPGAYRILFGTKGYIITETSSGAEIARGEGKELAAFFGMSKITAFETFDALKDIFKDNNDGIFLNTQTIACFNGIAYEVGELKLVTSNDTYTIIDVVTNTQVACGTADQIYSLFWIETFTPFSDFDALTSAINANQWAHAETLTSIHGVQYAVGQLSLSTETVIRDFGLFYYIYKGVDWVIFPPIIFLGIGAMTDFGPLIANPKSMLIGAAAQTGIFITFFCAISFLGFNAQEAAAIAIIGGADGPTAIYVTKKLAEHLLPAIAISAYSYMALIPIIQKPLMRLVTTKKERAIKMKQLRKVSKLEKIVFPILVTFVVGILLPDAMPLLGMLMLGNLLKESGVCGRLVDTAQNALMNIVTIFLGVMVGSKATGALFLNLQTLGIIVLGLCAFCMGTLGGLLVAKLMCKLSGGKINPLIGSAGVSAVPMAARISQDVGREADPDNHLLMHAMGPNVAGVIGSAIAAGVLLALFL